MRTLASSSSASDRSASTSLTLALRAARREDLRQLSSCIHQRATGIRAAYGNPKAAVDIGAKIVLVNLAAVLLSASLVRGGCGDARFLGRLGRRGHRPDAHRGRGGRDGVVDCVVSLGREGLLARERRGGDVGSVDCAFVSSSRKWGRWTALTLASVEGVLHT